ncbi:MAG TPA: DUF742 domain-containing protein, partial [Trebonia sp.]|nr:DUF742 domain-containing protein [Trebonia sp.]
MPADGSYPVRGRPQPEPSQWVRRDSGPVVRPYAVTGGRTEPVDGEVLDVVAVVVAVPGGGADDDDPFRRTPEHRRILALCERQTTVADIAAGTGLPLGVVRVLLSDLIMGGAVNVVRRRPTAGQRPDNNVLQELLNGL